MSSGSIFKVIVLSKGRIWDLSVLIFMDKKIEVDNWEVCTASLQHYLKQGNFDLIN